MLMTLQLKAHQWLLAISDYLGVLGSWTLARPVRT
jgi:hypothetical protein